METQRNFRNLEQIAGQATDIRAFGVESAMASVPVFIFMLEVLLYRPARAKLVGVDETFHQLGLLEMQAYSKLMLEIWATLGITATLFPEKKDRAAAWLAKHNAASAQGRNGSSPLAATRP